MKRLGEEFFHRDVLDVAPDLVGKIIVSHPNYKYISIIQ